MPDPLFVWFQASAGSFRLIRPAIMPAMSRNTPIPNRYSGKLRQDHWITGGRRGTEQGLDRGTGVVTTQVVPAAGDGYALVLGVGSGTPALVVSEIAARSLAGSDQAGNVDQLPHQSGDFILERA